MVKVVAVFGLSGVGKSWLISNSVEGMEITHVQASQLLREARAEIIGRMETLEELRQGAVLTNQALIIEAFSRLRTSATKSIVFDGHSVIDTGQQLVEIPLNVIRALAPEGLVFVKDEPIAIIAKRAGDHTKIRPVRSEHEIGTHQMRSQSLCEQYADALGVSLKIIQAGDTVGFSVAMASILGSSRPA